VDADMVEPLARHYGADQFIGPPGGAATTAGSYTVLTEIKAQPVSDDGSRFVDEYGVEYRRGAALHVERPALPEPSLSGYRFPDLSTDSHFDGLEEWLVLHAERFRIVQLGMLFFERSWGMRGMENLLMDMHEHPAFVDELMAGLADTCLGVIDRLLRDFGDRIDAIGLSDDYGGQNNLLISPDHWRRFIKPHLRPLYARIRDAEKFVYMHSCGHVIPIIPDLIEVGGNMLQPLQPEAMDVFEVKRRFGRDLCLMGGISTQHTLPLGTPQQVRDEVRECRRRLGEGGGYVMAPAKPILPGVPVENAVALIDSFLNQQ
jgi:uroporphyrinogen decarboxylase